MIVVSVDRGGLPTEGSEFSSNSDRDDTGGLAVLAVEVFPALFEPSLCAPCDRYDSGILASLAALQGWPDVWSSAVVVRGL